MTRTLSAQSPNPLGELETFLARPPEGTPAAVLDFLRETMAATPAGLPARVFREAVEQSSVAISIADPNGVILYANPSFVRVTGYPVEEVLGHNESMLSSKSTPNIVYKTLWGRLSQGKPWSGLLLNARKNGEHYLAEVTIAPVVCGRTLYYLGMHRDVTQVHQLQQRVTNQKALIESVVDASPVATALLDDQGRVILDNHEYKKLVGDLKGREPAQVILEVLARSTGWDFKAAREEGRGFAGQEIALDGIGGRPQRWFTCSGTWVQEKDTHPDTFFEPRRRTYLLLVASEVTSLKRQQEAISLNAMRAIMAEDERLEGIRETLEGAIYQLQAPLNMVQAAAAILRRREPGETFDPEPLRNALDQALAAGQQAVETLEMSIPHGAPEEPTSLNVNELLREVLSVVTQRLLAEGVTVDWSPSPVLPTLTGRGRQLRGMFKQLIGNAIDAMAGARQRELRIATGVEEGRLRVVVEDTGHGIPQELRVRVFEPFFTTREMGRHAGVGLTLVRDVVSGHRGMVRIDPDYTQGCRMEILLPLRPL